MLNSPTSTPSRVAQTSSEQGKPTSLDAGASEKRGERVGSTGVDAALVEPFVPFAHQEVLANPYDDELHRDTEFQGQLHQQLLELILEFHAWSTSRPASESLSTGDVLVKETREIQALEQEQGMWTLSFEQSRLRLVEFITRIKAALAALTGFGL